MNVHRTFLRVDNKLKFKIYWLMPETCIKNESLFNETTWNYRSFHNSSENFIILNNPGCIPSLLIDSQPNGGIPQNGIIKLHIDLLNKSIRKAIPKEDYNGYAIIIMNQWGFTWQQNVGNFSIYKEQSRRHYNEKYMDMSKKINEKEVATGFNIAAKEFLKETLLTAKKTRTSAKWGFLGMPVPGQHSKADSDNLTDLYTECNILYPLIEFKTSSTIDDYNKTITSCVQVSNRNKIPCLPLLTYKYSDDEQYLSENNIERITELLKNYDLQKLAIWNNDHNDYDTEK